MWKRKIKEEEREVQFFPHGFVSIKVRKQKKDAEVSAKHNGCEKWVICSITVFVLNLHRREA